MKRTVGILVLLAALSLFAFAAPAPWGIAVNYDTNECAGYWGGDEFTGYGLPDGWKAYYPNYGNDGANITTDEGECTFEYDHEEDCCRQLGIKYVAKNIGAGDKTQLMERPEGYPQNKIPGWVWMLLAAATALILVAVPIVAVAVVVYVVWKRKAS